MTVPTPSSQANIELVRAGFEALNADHLDACVERLAPADLIINHAELPEPLCGRDTWRQGAELIKRAFPALHARIEDVVAADDRVVVRLTMHGIHSGDYLGFPPTGRPVSYVSHEFYRVTDGLIAEEWICSGTATLRQQIRADVEPVARRSTPRLAARCRCQRRRRGQCHRRCDPSPSSMYLGRPGPTRWARTRSDVH